MAKINRDKVIAELDILQAGYSEEMTDEQLAELLKKAKAEKKEKEKAAEKEDLESNIDYTGVRLGESTILNLHRRITIIERKLKLDK